MESAKLAPIIGLVNENLENLEKQLFLGKAYKRLGRSKSAKASVEGSKHRENSKKRKVRTALRRRQKEARRINR